MLRTFVLLFAFAVPTFAAAEELKFTADVHAKITVAGETAEVQAKLNGETGKPLQINISDVAETKFEVKISSVEKSPEQYVAELQITRDGKVLSQPTVTSLLGRTAVFEVTGDKNRIWLELNVKERKSAARDY